ncbi:hypothetical protein [Alteromonas sp. CYL-A6]|uniref:hypothetical protein n=1 Tax=Alteromonas nitratireducens TaxID=3390813 RepID=UPI0034BA5575
MDSRSAMMINPFRPGNNFNVLLHSPSAEPERLYTYCHGLVHIHKRRLIRQQPGQLVFIGDAGHRRGVFGSLASHVTEFGIIDNTILNPFLYNQEPTLSAMVPDLLLLIALSQMLEEEPPDKAMRRAFADITEALWQAYGQKVSLRLLVETCREQGETFEAVADALAAFYHLRNECIMRREDNSLQNKMLPVSGIKEALPTTAREVHVMPRGFLLSDSATLCTIYLYLFALQQQSLHSSEKVRVSVVMNDTLNVFSNTESGAFNSQSYRIFAALLKQAKAASMSLSYASARPHGALCQRVIAPHAAHHML